ncbi:hypothetical protein D3C85_757800 [compost metagenome]
MSVIEIKPVVSGQSKAVIGIAGQSGDGKTLTALYIARGMVNNASEIGFLDTENKRGSLYANVLDAPFMIGDLYPPFSPSRYADAIKQFQESGVKVLVIDSVSHEWEGDGGCDDIANAPKADGSPRKVANWIQAKREHKKFMNVLLQSNLDIICCIRAREKTDFKIIDKPVSLGIQPICEKNFMFEMTASILMGEQGTKHVHLKVPNFLKDAFGNGSGYLGIDTGKKIRKWLDQGEKEDPEIAKIKSEALMVCEQGTEALNALFKSLSKDYQKNIKIITHFGICKESAKGYDELNNTADDESGITIDGLKGLFDEAEPSLNDEEKAHCKRIIDEKEVNSYQKLHKFLTDKTK